MNQDAASTLTLRMAESIDDVQRKGVPHVVDFTVVQLNDVYDAAPVEGGTLGGLARVATLVRKLKQENPNLLTLMIGDFLSPSAISATTGDAGQHMIEALNALGLTHATVGNHEFDLPEADLKLRIGESRFKWIVSNVKDVEGRPFEGVAENEIIEFANDAGERVRVALLGVCIDSMKKWAKFANPVESARAQVAALEGKADVFLAMTHLTIAEDKILGTEVPRLDVLLGGHEHETAKAIVGEDATPIFKADSNARSAFVHRFRFDTQTRVAHLFSQLVPIDASLEEEPETAAIVNKWLTVTYSTLRAQGHDPLEVVGRATERLDGREAAVRSRPTNLTRLIAETFLAAAPEADAFILTSGTIRIDGEIPPGDILYFDVVRIFPLASKLSLLSMPGSLIRMLLGVGEGGAGTGNFQVRSQITRSDDSGWLIKGSPLVDDQLYKLLFNEIPAAALAYPPFKGSGTTKLYDTRDIRDIFTERLRRDLPNGSP